MNFNIIILLFIFSSCGLKKNPIVPKDNALPVISDRYKVIYSKVKSEEKEETTKDKKKK